MTSWDTDDLAERLLRIAGFMPVVLGPRTPTVPLRGVDMAKWRLYNLRLSPPEAAGYLLSSTKRLEVSGMPTVNQLVRKGRRPRHRKDKAPALSYMFNSL